MWALICIMKGDNMYYNLHKMRTELIESHMLNQDQMAVLRLLDQWYNGESTEQHIVSQLVTMGVITPEKE